MNGERAKEHAGIVANPNCCSIPLTLVLGPLRDAVGRQVRVATYQSASGAGSEAMERLRSEASDDHDLRMDWSFDGVEFDEEAKIRDETRKILDEPDLPISATSSAYPCWSGMRRQSGSRRKRRSRPTTPSGSSATPRASTWTSSRRPEGSGRDDVLVGRIRRDVAEPEALALFLGDNLRKGGH